MVSTIIARNVYGNCKDSSKIGMFSAQSDFLMHFALIMILAYIWTNVTYSFSYDEDIGCPCLWFKVLKQKHDNPTVKKKKKKNRI